MTENHAENPIDSEEILQKLCKQSSLAMVAADTDLNIISVAAVHI